MTISLASLAGGGAAKETRIDYFASTSSWTAPAGVNYAIVTLVAGGGGGGRTAFNNGQFGGTTSFSSISLSGATPGCMGHSGDVAGLDANQNTGLGGSGARNTATAGGDGMSSHSIQRGLAVTPSTSYTVTVGGGGNGGGIGGTRGGSGGSGYVTVQYLVEV